MLIVLKVLATYLFWEKCNLKWMKKDWSILSLSRLNMRLWMLLLKRTWVTERVHFLWKIQTQMWCHQVVRSVEAKLLSLFVCLWRVSHWKQMSVSRIHLRHPDSRSVRLWARLYARKPRSYSGNLRSCNLTYNHRHCSRRHEQVTWSFLCHCLLLQHISSLRSPQSSTPSHVTFRETHLSLAHLKPHSSPERTKWYKARKTNTDRTGSLSPLSVSIQ